MRTKSLEKQNLHSDSPHTHRPEKIDRSQAPKASKQKQTRSGKVHALPAHRPSTAPVPTKEAGMPSRPGQGKQTIRPVLVKQAATRTKRRRRHGLLILSFILMVVAPLAFAGWYLFQIAAGQYASHVGFSVRQEESSSPVELLGGITSLSSTGSSDSDILYEYIHSHELVQTIDTKLDLRQIYSKPKNDPVFSIAPDATQEALLDYWSRVVKVFYDTRTQLIEIRVTAFSPEDAQSVAQAIFAQSSQMINELSAIARDDATHYAREELDIALNRLKSAREAMTRFRSVNQIVDPTADLQGQMGLLNSLQEQKAGALIELDLARSGDPRLKVIRRKIEVISSHIEKERKKLGVHGADGDQSTYATLMQEFENLTVDREFAETTYTAALANYDGALFDARKQSRYLAAYVKPTLAQEARYPQRIIILSVTGAFCFLGWAILCLIAYSLRDRR